MGRPRPTCSVEGCDRPHRGLGYCVMHHTRFVRHGDPLHVEVILNDPLARLLQKVDKTSSPNG